MWVNGKERRREDWVGLLVCSAAGLLLVVPTAAAAPWTIRLVPAVAPASWAILRVLLVLWLLPGRGGIFKSEKFNFEIVASRFVASAEEEGREPRRDHREERKAGKSFE